MIFGINFWRCYLQFTQKTSQYHLSSQPEPQDKGLSFQRNYGAASLGESDKAKFLFIDRTESFDHHSTIPLAFTIVNRRMRNYTGILIFFLLIQS